MHCNLLQLMFLNLRPLDVPSAMTVGTQLNAARMLQDMVLDDAYAEGSVTSVVSPALSQAFDEGSGKSSAYTSTDRLNSMRIQRLYRTAQTILPIAPTFHTHADANCHLVLTAKNNNERTSSLRSVKMASNEDCS